MIEKPVIVGHPFAPSGRGEDVRATFRSFKAAGMSVLVRDVYGLNNPRDPDYVAEFGGSLTHHLSNRVNIYLLNGDEVAQAWDHLSRETPEDSYKIVFPAWELSKYPADWARHLERFDEVWAASKFTGEGLTAAVRRPVTYLPLSSEVALSSFLGRRHFGIPESSFVFLFMFDFTSYIHRKNPFAVIEAYSRYLKRHPYHDVCLVLKLNNPLERTKDFEEFQARCGSSGGRIVLIEKTLSDNETKNLVRNCDCFFSLHRSEGFGRGLSEAMFLGRPVIATSYSGNVDFMTPDSACLVGYDLKPVEDGQYPYAAGQVWADPHVEEAVDWMERLVADRQLGRSIGENASRRIRSHFGYRASGIRYVERIMQLGLPGSEAMSDLSPDVVRMAYRLFLNREPESDAIVQHYVGAFRTFQELRREFVASAEFQDFQSSIMPEINRTYWGKPAAVEVDVPPATLAKLMDRVRAQWRKLGESEPYWSVLSHENFLMQNMTNEKVEAFYESGRRAANLIDLFEEKTGARAPRGVCFELGCGVGRVTVHLAQRFERVVAADISPGNLALCERQLQQRGITNVETLLLKSPDQLLTLAPFDFFYSVIVLQHNPPPIQKLLLENVLGRIESGGGCLFQTPHVWPQYTFAADAFLASPEQTIDMHCLPKPIVLKLLQDHGFQIRDVDVDTWAGKFGSYTYFATR